MDLVSDFIFDDMCEDIFPYLDSWKDDNQIDMNNAPKYIMEDYNFSKEDASRVYWAWREERGIRMTEQELDVLVERVDAHQEMLEKINNILEGALTTFENLRDMIDNIYARIKTIDDAATVDK